MMTPAMTTSARTRVPAPLPLCSVTELLALHRNPAATGRLATAARTAAVGGEIQIREAPKHAAPSVAALVRNGDVCTLDAWPDASSVAARDRLVLQVDANETGRNAFARWLVDQASSLPAGSSLAPFSNEAAGLHRLWCIAAARLAVGPSIRIEARHDLLGIRLAQVAVGFGADTLAGPLQADRKLPLAGVPRPSETTRDGLGTIITSMGLQAVQTHEQSAL